MGPAEAALEGAMRLGEHREVRGLLGVSRRPWLWRAPRPEAGGHRDGGNRAVRRVGEEVGKRLERRVQPAALVEGAACRTGGEDDDRGRRWATPAALGEPL